MEHPLSEPEHEPVRGPLDEPLGGPHAEPQDEPRDELGRESQDEPQTASLPAPDVTPRVPAFRERLTPGAGPLVAAVCLGAALGLALWIVSPVWGVSVGVVAAAGFVVALVRTSPVVTFTGPGAGTGQPSGTGQPAGTGPSASGPDEADRANGTDEADRADRADRADVSGALAGGVELHAGRARVPVALLAAPRALDGPALRAELGPGSDARVFACLRPWVPTAVRVEVRDPADPTPAWLVGSRRPDELVAALRAAGVGAR